MLRRNQIGGFVVVPSPRPAGGRGRNVKFALAGGASDGDAEGRKKGFFAATHEVSQVHSHLRYLTMRLLLVPRVTSSVTSHCYTYCQLSSTPERSSWFFAHCQCQLLFPNPDFPSPTRLLLCFGLGSQFKSYSKQRKMGAKFEFSWCA